MTKFSTRRAKSKFTPGSLKFTDPRDDRLTLHSSKQPSQKLYLKSIADLSVVCKDALVDVNKNK